MICSASPTTLPLHNVTFASPNSTGPVAAVGAQGVAVISPDTVTWKATTTGAPGWLRGIKYVTTRGSRAGRAATCASCEMAARGNPHTSGATHDLNFLGGLTFGFSFQSHVPDLALTGGEGGHALEYSAVVSTFMGEFARPYTGPPPTLPVQFGTISAAPELAAPVRLRGALYDRKPSLLSYQWATVGEGGDLGFDGVRQTTRPNLNFEGIATHNGRLLVVGQDETILESDGVFPPRLINLSTRGSAGGSAGPLIAGKVISGFVAETHSRACRWTGTRAVRRGWPASLSAAHHLQRSWRDAGLEFRLGRRQGDRHGRRRGKRVSARARLEGCGTSHRSRAGEVLAVARPMAARVFRRRSLAP